MYVCICHGVCEKEVRGCIQEGARTEDAVGDACGAGTGCGNCLERIADLLEAEYGPAALTAG
ncbi:MAG TPA: (2Fe-2S)-binding protein [Stackebrandtia sp.]|uniref:(2Fe-2S)-binding protein n=1 Tax=Stackebrandtia sp. TaxID=2023065 RepID=UPI002D4480B1|nr:(2Fe-2S)-binding protein [Stackebrandtia sp.]HZE37495.1 (2Fe-2S)-binding protein [Stackebrandtia sp.]